LLLPPWFNLVKTAHGASWGWADHPLKETKGKPRFLTAVAKVAA